jgi:hypothetical protein
MEIFGIGMMKLPLSMATLELFWLRLASHMDDQLMVN